MDISSATLTVIKVFYTVVTVTIGLNLWQPNSIFCESNSGEASYRMMESCSDDNIGKIL